MITGKDAENHFAALVSRWLPAYRCLMTSVLIIKDGKQPFIFAGRKLCLPIATVPPNSSFRFESEHLLALREVQEMPDGDWVSEPANGMMFINGKRYDLLFTEGNTSYSLDRVFMPSYQSSDSPARGFPALRLYGAPWNGWMARFGGKEKLEWELKTAEAPYASLDDLLQELALTNIAELGDRTRIDVIAGIPAMLSQDSTIKGEKLHLICHSSQTSNIAKIRIGYILYQQQSPVRGHISGQQLAWRQRDNIQVGEIELSARNVIGARIFLTYDEAGLQEITIFDHGRRINPRQAIYETFDPNLVVAKRFITGGGKDAAGDLERGVAAYLHFSGFSVQLIGRVAELGEGPDILAIAEPDMVLVIECTTGPIDNNQKLSKLALRAEDVKTKLTQSGHRYMRVLPVMWTTLPRAILAGDISKATELGLSVIAREEIDRIVQSLHVPANAAATFQEFVNRIPIRQSTSQIAS